MALGEKHALITGSSRGIGRGIALALAESHVKVAIHYYQNAAAAEETLAQVRKRGSDGVLLQADVTHPEQITDLFRKVKTEFGTLDIFVSNARPEVPEFFQGPLDITLKQWDTAFDSQAKAFLVGVREALPLMVDGGRIFAITYAEGSRTGGLQPWVGMGSAKAALESLVRYFAVAVAKRGITVNAISPGWTEDSVLNTLPEQAQQLNHILDETRAAFQAHQSEADVIREQGRDRIREILTDQQKPRYESMLARMDARRKRRQ